MSSDPSRPNRGIEYHQDKLDAKRLNLLERKIEQILRLIQRRDNPNTTVKITPNEGSVVTPVGEINHADLIGNTNDDHIRYLDRSGVRPMTGDLDMGDNAVVDIGFLDFNLSNGIAHQEGRMSWNPDDGTANLGMKGNVVNLQIGQEIIIRAKNNQGATISDGEAVFVSGASGTNIEIQKPIATNPAQAPLTIGLATEDIGDQQPGYVTIFGRVRDIDTSGTPVSETWLDGDILYLSATSAGALTKVRPTQPDTGVIIGVVVRAHATEGEIGVNPVVNQRLAFLSDVLVSSLGQDQLLSWDAANNVWVNDINSTTLMDAWNGTCLQNFDFTITSNGTVITGSLEVTGGGEDLRYKTSTGFRDLNTDPTPVTVTLTPGTDNVPQIGHVYIDHSDDTVKYKTSNHSQDWPSVQHTPIAYVDLRTAATTQTDGAWGNQNINNRPEDETSNGRGWIQIAGDDIRSLGPKWLSGVTPTITIVGASSPDDVYLAVTSGIVRQFNLQTFPAINMQTGDDIHVMNDSVSPFKTVTNLNAELTDASGVSMSGRYFWHTFFGKINKSGETSHIAMNLPTGSYTTLANAQADVAGTKVRDKPVNSSNTMFIISETLFSHSSGGGGTFTEIETNTLLGIDAPGGGGSTIVSPITSFSDAQFDIFNSADPTKIIEVDASGITTATTRNWVAPDKDLTFAVDTDAEAVDAIEAIAAGVAVLADTVPFVDATDGVLKQESLTDINAILVHNNLTGIDAGDINHLTDAQVTALHATYTDAEAVDAVEAVANAAIATGDSVVFVDVTDGVLKQDLVSDLIDLVPVVVAGDLNHNDLANIDAGDIKHLTAAQVAALHATYTDAEAISAVEGEATLDLQDSVGMGVAASASFNLDILDATDTAALRLRTTGTTKSAVFTLEGTDNMAINLQAGGADIEGKWVYDLGLDEVQFTTRSEMVFIHESISDTEMLRLTSTTATLGGDLSLTDGRVTVIADADAQGILVQRLDSNFARYTLERTYDATSPADNHIIGQFVFKGEDSAGGGVNVSILESVILDVTNTTEDGRLNLYNFRAGSSTLAFYVDENGNAFTDGTHQTFSSKRLKSNYEPITNALDIVGQLNGIYYDRYYSEKTTKRQIGFEAEAVGKVLSEVVEYEDGSDPSHFDEEEELYAKSIAYGEITALHNEAIKELKAEKDVLQQTIDDQQILISSILTRLDALENP